MAITSTIPIVILVTAFGPHPSPPTSHFCTRTLFALAPAFLVLLALLAPALPTPTLAFLALISTPSRETAVP